MPCSRGSAPGGAGAAARVQEGATTVDASYGTLHGLYWICANLAAEHPLLLIVDDAQWVEEASLRFLGVLARRRDALRVLAVVARPGAGAPARRAGCRPADRRLGLRPLSLAASRALLAAGSPDGMVETGFAVACEGPRAATRCCSAGSPPNCVNRAWRSRRPRRPSDQRRARVGSPGRRRHASRLTPASSPWTKPRRCSTTTATCCSPPSWPRSSRRKRPPRSWWRPACSRTRARCVSLTRSCVMLSPPGCPRGPQRAARACGRAAVGSWREPGRRRGPPAGDRAARTTLGGRAARGRLGRALARGAPDEAAVRLRRALAEPPSSGEQLTLVFELARAESLLGCPHAVALVRARPRRGGSRRAACARALIELVWHVDRRSTARSSSGSSDVSPRPARTEPLSALEPSRPPACRPCRSSGGQAAVGGTDAPSAGPISGAAPWRSACCWRSWRSVRCRSADRPACAPTSPAGLLAHRVEAVAGVASPSARDHCPPQGRHESLDAAERVLGRELRIARDRGALSSYAVVCNFPRRCCAAPPAISMGPRPKRGRGSTRCPAHSWAASAARRCPGARLGRKRQARRSAGAAHRERLGRPAPRHPVCHGAALQPRAATPRTRRRPSRRATRRAPGPEHAFPATPRAWTPTGTAGRGPHRFAARKATWTAHARTPHNFSPSPGDGTRRGRSDRRSRPRHRSRPAALGCRSSHRPSSSSSAPPLAFSSPKRSSTRAPHCDAPAGARRRASRCAAVVDIAAASRAHPLADRARQELNATGLRVRRDARRPHRRAHPKRTPHRRARRRRRNPPPDCPSPVRDGQDRRDAPRARLPEARHQLAPPDRRRSSQAKRRVNPAPLRSDR